MDIYTEKLNVKQRAKVVGHFKTEEGNLIGQANPNPFINSIMYEVEFDDGLRMPLAANIIADSIYAQVGEDGSMNLILDSIVDYRKERSML